MKAYLYLRIIMWYQKLQKKTKKNYNCTAAAKNLKIFTNIFCQ